MSFKMHVVKGMRSLKELIDLSLLEITEGRKFVKMNKVLRKMALKMSSQRNDFKLLVKPREGLNDFPKKEEWEQATRISVRSLVFGLPRYVLIFQSLNKTESLLVPIL